MLAFDHLVLAVPDADLTSMEFSAASGLAVHQGGRHSQWGTFNFLSHFRNLCYVEWLCVFDQAKAEQSENPLIQLVANQLKHGREGIIQAAFRTSDMDGMIDYYQKKDLKFQGPFEGKRRKPDGSVLAWRMLFPLDPAGGILPFLIEWNGSPPQPEASFINQKEIKSIQWASRDPELTKQIWMKMYKLPNPAEQDNYSWKLTNTEISLVHGTGIRYYLE